MKHERKKKLSRREKQMRVEKLRELLRTEDVYTYKIKQSGNVDVFMRKPFGKYGLKKITLSKDLLNDF